MSKVNKTFLKAEREIQFYLAGEKPNAKQDYNLLGKSIYQVGIFSIMKFKTIHDALQDEKIGGLSHILTQLKYYSIPNPNETKGLLVFQSSTFI